MAQVRHGPWSFGSPAMAHDPMRQRVQFHQKARRKGQQQNQAPRERHAECRQPILPHLCHPLSTLTKISPEVPG